MLHEEEDNMAAAHHPQLSFAELNGKCYFQFFRGRDDVDSAAFSRLMGQFQL